MDRFFLSVLLSVIIGCASTPKTKMEERVPAGKSAQPKLFIQPAPVFDMECSQKTGFKVDPTWSIELNQKIGTFQGEWDKKSNDLIRTSEELAGRNFFRTEYSVALTLCKWTPMGHPFIVSARPFLDGPAHADPLIKQPMSMNSFVSMTHHELLHSLVDNILNDEFSSSSAMIIKYQNEHFNVLVHLHLMAIQKASYQKLGESDLLQKTDALYAYIGGDYQRAWEIVTKEGTDVFLKELQSYNSKRP